MIATLLRISRLNLSRDRVVQLMVFAVPIAFFSIFAAIFGRQGNAGGMPHIAMAIVDEERSDASRELITALRGDSSLTVRESVTARPGLPDDATESRPARAPALPLDREAAIRMVHDGQAPIALVLPRGWRPWMPGSPVGLAPPCSPIPPIRWRAARRSACCSAPALAGW